MTADEIIAACDGADALVPTVTDNIDAALINAQLLQAGVNVYQIGLEKPSLEDIFLSLTAVEMTD